MTQPPLNPLLRQRWSPQEFEADHEISPDEIGTLLEAARWAPSAGNSQPWAFVPARRGDALHGRIRPTLRGGARRWGTQASLLMANLCHLYVPDSDFDYSEFAMYDLGQAVANLTVQAADLGLAVRQFRSFDRDAVHEVLNVAPGWQVATMSAIGRPPAQLTPYAAKLPDGSVLPRERRPLQPLAGTEMLQLPPD